MSFNNFGGFGGANMGQLMRQAQKMQEDIAKAKQEVQESIFTSSVGGGMVEVKMTGARLLQSINIKEEVIDPDDKEMLEDLIISAVNDCIEQIQRKLESVMPQMPTF